MINFLKFVNENFRKRKFSKSVFSNGLFHTIKENNFIQNKINNRYLGGVLRKYTPINKLTLKHMNELFQNDFLNFFKHDKIEIGYHQIRITCGKNYIGYPVPEGWHRDGFDFCRIDKF
jgi:hypothetical protein